MVKKMKQDQAQEVARIATSIHNETILLQAMARQVLNDAIAEDDVTKSIQLDGQARTLAATSVKIRQYIRMIG